MHHQSLVASRAVGSKWRTARGVGAPFARNSRNEPRSRGRSLRRFLPAGLGPRGPFAEGAKPPQSSPTCLRSPCSTRSPARARRRSAACGPVRERAIKIRRHPLPSGGGGATLRSMKSVAIFSLKGGSGRTTLAAHLVRRAQDRDIRTTAISLDRLGDLIRWLSKGREDTLIHSPDEAPQIPADASFVVYDCPRDLGSTERIKPDLWIVPVLPGRASAELLAPTLQQLTTSGSEVWVVSWQSQDTASLSALRDVVAPFPSVHIHERAIPESKAIFSAQEHLSFAWDVPSGNASDGSHVLAALCDDILAHLGFAPVR